VGAARAGRLAAAPAGPARRGRVTAPLGVLLLHGFTSSLRTVDGLLPTLERLRMPYRMPVLRGHGTRPEDLVGVTERDWYDDASRALDALLREAPVACVVGLSMGGLLALDLGIRRPKAVDSAVLVAPALRFKSRLVALSPLLQYVMPWYSAPSSFADPILARTNANYRRFPTRTFVRLYRYGRILERQLPRFDRPLLILQTHRDTIVDPRGAERILALIPSPHTEIVWFERSGHEMMQDLEREAVFARIEGFLRERMRRAATPAT